MKKIAPIIIVLAIATVLIILIIRDQNRKAAPDPPGIVTATGTIEITEVDVSPRISGRIITLTRELGEKADSG